LCEHSHLLVATGRTANTDGIGLERTGVELNDHGYIKVNERLQTTAANIWAAGDCAGSPQFTHVAYDDFRIVYDNLNGGNRTTRIGPAQFHLSFGGMMENVAAWRRYGRGIRGWRACR
jgi:pyruvate/2-oxoglutarate dehydrogenase complex dihydrolipoamide dehydrogenase (E3) component